MPKLILTLLIACSLLLGAACSGEPAKDTPPAAMPPTASGTPGPKIAYAAGFYDEERDAGGNTWRWMGPEGVVRLKNTGREMTLTITGSSPLSPLKSAPTVTVTLNGQQLEQFPGADAITKQYAVSPAQQGPGEYSELRIASSKSFVPQEVNPKFQDTRRLAFQLNKLIWEEKPAP